MPRGVGFEAPEVLALTRRTRELLPTITLSVTVPHILALDEAGAAGRGPGGSWG